MDALGKENSELEHEKFKKGDYSVHVFIEESKGLLPPSGDRNFNPVISVKCFSKIKCTRKLKDVTSGATSIWSEHLYFSKLDVQVTELEESKILIEVLDSRTLKNSLIGLYELDFTYVYFKPKHSIIHQWIILSNPYTEDMSVQRGLVKIGVNIIHENDKAEDLTIKSVSDSLLIPPQVSVKSMQLVIQFIQAFNLPKMDKSGTCDTFCVASFSTVKNKTKTDTASAATMSSHWFQELWLPVCQPSIANKVNITIWDSDVIGSDELVGSLNFYWDKIGMEHEAEYIWSNIYGAHDSIDNEFASLMNTNEKLASNWRGRLLLKLFRKDSEKAVLKSINIENTKIKEHIQEEFEVEDDFQINAQILEGVNLPFKNGLFSIMVKFSGKGINSKTVEAVNGCCKWYENIKRAVIGIPKHAILPDVFIYLMYDNSPVCYARIKPEELADPKPKEKWIKLIPDQSVGKVKNPWEGGYVLLKIFVGPIEQEGYDKKFWETKFDPVLKLKNKLLVCNLYQCRNLPAADPSGLADPFVKVICGTSEYQTDKQSKLEILNPLWYESFSLPISIGSLDTAPPIIIQVWDYDAGSSDEIMGLAIKEMKNVPENPSDAPRPEWYKLSLGTQDTEEGEILLSFFIVDQNPPPMILPPLREVTVEIYALGFRNLKPALGWLPVNKAFLKVDIRAMQLPGEQSLVTELSTQPNNPGPNPNIGSVLKFKTKIPEDPLFCPNLTCTVHDYLLSGKSQPVLGAFNLDLRKVYSNRLSEKGIEKIIRKQLEVREFEVREEVNDGEETGLLKGNEVVPENVKKRVSYATLPMNLNEAQQANTVVVLPQFKQNPNPRQTIKLTEVKFEDYNYMSLGYNRNPEDGNKHYRYLLSTPLEKSLLFGQPPFQVFEIKKGQVRGSTSSFSLFGKKNNESTLETAGTFKGIVRISSHLEEDGFEQIAKLLLVKTNCIVRVYIVDALDLEQMDLNSPSDPYLIIKLGKQKISDREHYQEDNPCPKFLKYFDISTTFPGDSTLKLQVWDHEDLFADKKIGTIKIDLEDRFFNEDWKKLPEKPIETGKLTMKSSKQARGFLRYWVEIHPSVAVPKPWDISAKPPEPFEVRLIIWRCEGVPNMDAEGVSDLYVVSSINDGAKKETDTHYRAQNGEASWNWRKKFPITLDQSSRCVLNLSLWDRDLLSSNDAIGDACLDLTDLAQEALNTGEKQTKLGDPEKWTQRALRRESEKFFVDFSARDSNGAKIETGKVLISVEILPESKAKACKNGEGRSEPNIEPTLQPPEGRIQLTMNPIKMASQMIGADMRRKIYMWGCIVCCVALCIMMFPMLVANGFSQVLFF